jgi:hypothetical protein
LELADWDLAEGIRSAREDGEWEQELGDADALHSGQIQFKFKGGRLQTSGAGLSSPPRKAASKVGDAGESPRPAVVTPKRVPPRIVSREEIPDIATKSVKAHDIYAVRFFAFWRGVPMTHLYRSGSCVCPAARPQLFDMCSGRTSA